MQLSQTYHPCCCSRGRGSHAFAYTHAHQHTKRVAIKVSAQGNEVEAEEAKKLLEREGHFILDIRSAREYDMQHITKPTRVSVNWPLSDIEGLRGPPVGVSQRTPLIVMDGEGGADAERAVDILTQGQFEKVLKLKGGYIGWSQVWSPSGKRVVSGRWVSTGKEALKSGLTVPGAAESYTEGGDLNQARWSTGFKRSDASDP